MTTFVMTLKAAPLLAITVAPALQPIPILPLERCFALLLKVKTSVCVNTICYPSITDIDLPGLIIMTHPSRIILKIQVEVIPMGPPVTIKYLEISTHTS